MNDTIRYNIYKLYHKINYSITKVAIIDKEYSINKLLQVPYYMIVTDVTMIEKCKAMNDRLIGVYTDKPINVDVPKTIKVATKTDYNTITDFVKSIYKNAEPWYLHEERPRLHIILQVWRPAEQVRLEELQTALYKNAINPFIDYIHISLDGADSECVLDKIPEHCKYKIKYFNTNGRLTYKNALEYMGTLPSNDYSALINTDIYFDHTISAIWNVDMTNVCFALMRYEACLNYALELDNTREPYLENTSGVSQDSWIFKNADIIDKLFDENAFSSMDFTLGILGCDNVFAAELVLLHWKVINPVFSIHTFHLHESNVRTYTEKSRIINNCYFSIHPVAIENNKT